jgi:hypothetical protein
MIAGMDPDLTEGRFVFTTNAAPDLLPHAVATVAEDEGLTMILPADLAEGAPMRRITLRVWSALDGTGLTAAVSTALAEAGIPCNMIAGFHHDHLYVPEAQAERALTILRALQKSAL